MKYYKAVKEVDGRYFSAVVMADWIKQEYFTYEMVEASVGGFFVFDDLEECLRFCRREHYNLLVFECTVEEEIVNAPFCDEVFYLVDMNGIIENLKKRWEFFNDEKRGMDYFFPRSTKCFKRLKLTRYVCTVEEFVH